MYLRIRAFVALIIGSPRSLILGFRAAEASRKSLILGFRVQRVKSFHVKGITRHRLNLEVSKKRTVMAWEHDVRI